MGGVSGGHDDGTQVTVTAEELPLDRQRMIMVMVVDAHTRHILRFFFDFFQNFHILFKRCSRKELVRNRNTSSHTHHTHTQCTLSETHTNTPSPLCLVTLINTMSTKPVTSVWAFYIIANLRYTLNTVYTCIYVWTYTRV